MQTDPEEEATGPITVALTPVYTGWPRACRTQDTKGPGQGPVLLGHGEGEGQRAGLRPEAGPCLGGVLSPAGGGL